MARPPLPSGVESLREFGRMIGWATGDERALARMTTLTRTELETMGMTAELAEVGATSIEK